MLMLMMMMHLRCHRPGEQLASLPAGFHLHSKVEFSEPPNMQYRLHLNFVLTNCKVSNTTALSLCRQALIKRSRPLASLAPHALVPFSLVCFVNFTDLQWREKTLCGRGGETCRSRPMEYRPTPTRLPPRAYGWVIVLAWNPALYSTCSSYEH